MGMISSSDPRIENSDSQPRINEAAPSEKLGDSSEESDQLKEGGDAEGEEEGECGFCLFMKGGGCKESFSAWEVCVEEAEKNKEDIVTKCMEVTTTLKKCMDAHSDYYQPILAAERAAEEQVKKDLETEKKKSVSEDEDISEEEVAARKQAQG